VDVNLPEGAGAPSAGAYLAPLAVPAVVSKVTVHKQTRTESKVPLAKLFFCCIAAASSKVAFWRRHAFNSHV
jgi:hypothetical protein